ncbi:STAS domain-containing protein [Modestobacter sp. VKM Ac-2978]|nr:STAS domain-containing protein [Modestobacter sp. VKM Ac-2978]MCZ2849807.1 STAS domain-containing protein [Modestobacter sp. VKM Ac-2978]
MTARDGWVVVQLSGEVDAQAVSQLQASLDWALLEAPPFLRIDLADVTYLSLSAMGAILSARFRAVRAHTDVVLSDAPRTLRKLMEIVDEDGLCSEPAVVVA